LGVLIECGCGLKASNVGSVGNLSLGIAAHNFQGFAFLQIEFFMFFGAHELDVLEEHAEMN
jgi:hypothetical protein